MLKTDYYVPMTEEDQRIYDLLVAADHELRQIDRIIDFSSTRSLVADAYSARLGRPADDPEIMFRLEFLQYKYNLSDRAVIRRAQTDVSFRLFLHLSLTSDLPDASLLSVFRQRVGETRHRQLFNEIVSQARQAGFVKDRLRLKDATHIIANIAIPTTLELIGQVMAQLLAALEPFVPEAVARWRTGEVAEQKQVADWEEEAALVARVGSLQALVAWAEATAVAQRALAAVVSEEKALARLEAMIEYGRKILRDRAPKAEDKLISLIDTDARRGVHGGSETKKNYFDGYVEDLLEDPDSEIVTAVIVGPGNADEGGQAPALVDQEEQAHGNDIAELSADRASTRGSVRRELHERDVQEHIPMNEPPRDPNYFSNEAFTYDAQRDRMICPAGQTSQWQGRDSRDHGTVYIFAAAVCQPCPQRAQCTSSACDKRLGRHVSISDYKEEYTAARAHNQTAAYQEVRKTHAKVERKHAEKTRYHGARRARYWGLARVTIQSLLTNIVVNVKRMVRLTRAAVAQMNFALWGATKAEVCPTAATG